MKAIDEEKIPLGKGVRLLQQDANGLVALFKPEGVLSHPNTPQDAPRSLLRASYDSAEECYQVGEGETARRIWLLNRLDAATSGVLLCAVRKEVAEAVRQQFEKGAVRKVYYALVFGTMSPAKQVWRDRLQVSREGGQLRTTSRGGVEAETSVRVERVFPGRYPVSLIELQPRTGRTHQLRVQCARRKLPIVGDQTYGDFSWNREFVRATKRKRLFLHSAAVSLDYRHDGKATAFSARAPLPKEFTP